jgi:hypothetical protein
MTPDEQPDEQPVAIEWRSGGDRVAIATHRSVS